MNVMQVIQAAPRGLRGGAGALIWTVVAAAIALSSVAFGEPLPTSYIHGIDDNSQLWVMELSGRTSGTSQLLGPSALTASAANGLTCDSGREQFFAADTASGESPDGSAALLPT